MGLNYFVLCLQVETSMSSMQYEVLQIPVPVTETHKNLSEGRVVWTLHTLVF